MSRYRASSINPRLGEIGHNVHLQDSTNPNAWEVGHLGAGFFWEVGHNGA